MIKKIKANNFKILEFVDINPKKGVTFVFGPNEAGKSTMMNIIETTLVGGKKILNPVRDNQKKAETEIELDEYTVKKTFTEKSVRLEVYDKEGNKQVGGLKLIEKLINKIGFDPHEFSRLNAKDQRKMLLELLNIDFADLDKQRADIFEERRDIGAQSKMLPQYTKEELEEVEKYKGVEEINVTELADELQKEHSKHRDYEERINSIRTIEETIKQSQKEIERLKNKIVGLQGQANDLRRMEAPKSNLSEMKEKFNSAEETNQKIRKAHEVGINSQRLTELGLKYTKKTKQIESIDTHKQNVLKNAKMPLDGLALTDECVVYNNRPFDQLSTSQKMKVSIAISLLLMDDKKEKIIMIREGNLLDNKSIDIVIEMSKKHNCYFFIEMVLDENSEIPKEGILIKEGRIIAVDGERVKK